MYTSTDTSTSATPLTQLGLRQGLRLSWLAEAMLPAHSLAVAGCHCRHSPDEDGMEHNCSKFYKDDATDINEQEIMINTNVS